MRGRVHVEVDFTGFPIIAQFAEAGSDEPQQRGDVRKDSDHAGASFELLIDSLDHVGGAHSDSVLLG